MNRATWLQDRRMQKFENVLRRWERRELSAIEAGEMLGVSERQFRRYRHRYDEDGLAGLADRRLGKASVKRVPVDKIVWMLGQYRTHHMGWNVKHFHEHLRRQHDFGWGYAWTKLQLHAAGLVDRATRRGPRPLHRDEVLDPMVMRVASFFPFQTTYYLNGHNFIEQELLISLPFLQVLPTAMIRYMQERTLLREQVGSENKSRQLR